MKSICQSLLATSFFVLLFISNLKAQDGVLIDYLGSYTRPSSAILDLHSSNQGFLAPRVALTATNAAGPISSPTNGLMVYNTATAGDVTPGYYYWEGSWKRFLNTVPASVAGSGTLNYVPKWTPDGVTLGNSQLFDNGTNVGIGTAGPTQKLTVAGNINKSGSWIVGDAVWGANNFEVHNSSWDGSTNGNYGGVVGGHMYSYGGIDIGTGSGNEAVGGQLVAATDIKSPIYYDRDNTAFYVNPNGNTLLNKMRIDQNTTTGGQWAHDPYGYGWGAPAGSFRNLEVSSSGDYATEPAMLRIHQWGSGAAEFWKPQGTSLFLRETPGGSDSWFNRFVVQSKLLVHRGSIPNGWDQTDWGALVSFRSPGTNVMANAHHGNSQLELVSDGPGTTHIGFHRPGIYGANFGLDNDNWFSTQGWSAGAGYTPIRLGSTVVNGNLTVTGTFPGDNLGNHTATTTLNMNSNLISNVGDILSTNNYGTGLVGLYSDVRYQNIFAMGTSWRLPADGTTPGNLYGLAWTHSNIGGQSKSGLGHQLLVMENGITKVALGSGIWTNYDITGNKLIDQNDPGYYVDPNGTSNTQYWTGRAKAGIGLTGKYTTPRWDYTADQNYWTGSMGWGTTDLNDVATWGSGFFDSWSSPGNGPGTTSHYVGLQGFHYTAGAGNAYGFQMVSTTNANRFHLRSDWGSGWQPWVEMITTANVGSYGDNLGNHTAATTLNMAGNDIIRVNEIVCDQNYGRGLVGVYTSDRYQNVFSMGTAYRLAADGSNTGNMYGLAWTHTNVGGQSKAGLSHQLLVMEAGATKVALGSGIWTNYDITGNKLIDQNDPGYYVDPNGSSNVYYMNAAQSFHTSQNDSWFPYVNGTNYFRGTTYAFNSTWYDENNTAYYLDLNNVSIVNDMRANIFYDYGNTGYYVDPNGSARLTGDDWFSDASGIVRIGHNWTWNYCVGGSYCCSWDWWGGCNGNCWDPCQSTQAYLKLSVYGAAESLGWWGWSDGRFKKNISTVPNALELVKHMKGVTYDWKDLGETYDERVINGQKEVYSLDESSDNTASGFRSDLGVIAQDLKEVLPMAVMEVEDKDSAGTVIGTHFSVNYDKIIPVLIEAIKEQQNQIEELQRLVGANVSKPASNSDANEALFKAMTERATTMGADVQEHVDKMILMIRNGKELNPEIRNQINEFIVNGVMPKR